MCGWNGPHPGLPGDKLRNYERTENAHKVRDETFIFHDIAVKYTLLGEQKIRAFCSRYAQPG